MAIKRRGKRLALLKPIRRKLSVDGFDLVVELTDENLSIRGVNRTYSLTFTWQQLVELGLLKFELTEEQRENPLASLMNLRKFRLAKTTEAQYQVLLQFVKRIESE